MKKKGAAVLVSLLRVLEVSASVIRQEKERESNQNGRSHDERHDLRITRVFMERLLDTRKTTRNDEVAKTQAVRYVSKSRLRFYR